MVPITLASPTARYAAFTKFYPALTVLLRMLATATPAPRIQSLSISIRLALTSVSIADWFAFARESDISQQQNDAGMDARVD
jgi:hypothetical protein